MKDYGLEYPEYITVGTTEIACGEQIRRACIDASSMRQESCGFSHVRFNKIRHRGGKLAERVYENYYDMPFGDYCGLLVNEMLMKKIQKLNYKHMEELKILLSNNFNNFELSNWTLAYPNDKQTCLHYFTKTDNDEKKNKINTISKLVRLRHIDNDKLYKTNMMYSEASEDVASAYMKDFDIKTEK